VSKILKFYVDYGKLEDAERFGMDAKVTVPSIKNTGYLGDAGIDLAAPYPVTVAAHSFKVIDTFIGFEFPEGVFGLLFPRGGDTFLLGAGVIDTGYTGTIKCKVINPYNTDMEFNVGDSVGQLILVEMPFCEPPELVADTKENIRESERGDSGRITSESNLR